MEKKFKCQSCGHFFSADTSKYVTCPQCGSDNVSLTKSDNKVLKFVLIGLGAIVVAGGVYFAVTKFMKSEPKESTYTPPVVAQHDEPAAGNEPATTTNTDGVSQDYVDQIAQSLPCELQFKNVGTPKYNEASKAFSLSATADIINGQTDGIKVSYTLETRDGQLISTSNDGQFTSVKPAAEATNPDGVYILKASAFKGTECISVIDKEVSGFIAPKPIQVPRLTVADVQALIDNRVGAATLKANKSLTDPCNVRCQNKISNPPQNLARLIETIDMSGGDMTATVVSLEYNANGQVSCVVYSATISE